MEFGKIIENRRKSLNLKQNDLAEICEISVKSIQKIENGNSNPTIKSINKILDILGLELQIQIKNLDNESGGLPK